MIGFGVQWLMSGQSGRRDKREGRFNRGGKCPAEHLRMVANAARFAVPCRRTGLPQPVCVVEGHALN